jgi:hypothetical protein
MVSFKGSQAKISHQIDAHVREYWFVSDALLAGQS